MTKTTTSVLIRIIQKLREERAWHASAIAEIDAVFKQCGLSADLPAASQIVAAPVAARVAKKGSAEEFVTTFLRSHVEARTIDINTAWKKAGRAGKADNTLLKMFKDRKISRTKIRTGQGSRYAMM